MDGAAVLATDVIVGGGTTVAGEATRTILGVADSPASPKVGVEGIELQKKKMIKILIQNTNFRFVSIEIPIQAQKSC